MSIVKLLINLGLVVIPFFIWPGYDTRQPKMALALMIALALSLLVIFNGSIKRFKNYWLLIFIGYLPINIYLAPKIEIILLRSNVGAFWVWKPIFFIVVFSLMLIAISSIKFSRKDIGTMFNIMVWCGFIMSLYVLSQWSYVDQFFVDNAYAANWNLIDNNRLGGTLGNPTIVSPFIAMIVPIALYLKRYIKAFVMCLAVYITHSQVAIGALIIALLFLIGAKGKKRLIASCLTLLIVFSVLVGGYFKSPKIKDFVNDNRRFQVWSMIVKDLTTPIIKDSHLTYPFTGFGIGSFGYTFHIKHRNNFLQAHNEYAELGYNTGLIGLILFLCGIGYMIRTNFSFRDVWKGRADRYRMTLLSSFICIALSACGTFSFQLGAHVFYVIIICGLLHNNKGGSV